MFADQLRPLIVADPSSIEELVFISIDATGVDVRIRVGAEFNVERVNFGTKVGGSVTVRVWCMSMGGPWAWGACIAWYQYHMYPMKGAGWTGWRGLGQCSGVSTSGQSWEGQGKHLSHVLAYPKEEFRPPQDPCLPSLIFN